MNNFFTFNELDRNTGDTNEYRPHCVGSSHGCRLIKEITFMTAASSI